MEPGESNRLWLGVVYWPSSLLRSFLERGGPQPQPRKLAAADQSRESVLTDGTARREVEDYWDYFLLSDGDVTNAARKEWPGSSDVSQIAGYDLKNLKEIERSLRAAVGEERGGETGYRTEVVACLVGCFASA